METVQAALEVVKGEKDSLQAQLVTVRSYQMIMMIVIANDAGSTAELGAGDQPTGEHQNSTGTSSTTTYQHEFTAESKSDYFQLFRLLVSLLVTIE